MISIAIVDDQTLFIKGLRLLIDSFDNIQVLFDAKNGQDLLNQLDIQEPQVILLDFQMPVMDGITALQIIKKKYPAIKVILLTMHDDEHLITHVIEQGANGYLLKNEEPEIVQQAIEAVVERDSYLTNYVSKALFRGIQNKQSSKITLNKYLSKELTGREMEVLALVCKEYTNVEIAKALFLSPRTIEGHRKNILNKTGARNSAGLVIFAIKHGLIEL